VPKTHLNFPQVKQEHVTSDPSTHEQDQGIEDGDSAGDGLVLQGEAGAQSAGAAGAAGAAVAGHHAETPVLSPERGAAGRSLTPRLLDSHSKHTTGQDQLSRPDELAAPRLPDRAKSTCTALEEGNGGISRLAASLLALKEKAGQDAADASDCDGQDGAKPPEHPGPKELVGEILDLVTHMCPTLSAVSAGRGRGWGEGKSRTSDGEECSDREEEVQEDYLGLLDDDDLLDEDELRERGLSVVDLCERLLAWQGLPLKSDADAVAREYHRLRNGLEHLQRPYLNGLAQLLGVRAEMTSQEISANTVCCTRICEMNGYARMQPGSRDIDWLGVFLIAPRETGASQGHAMTRRRHDGPSTVSKGEHSWTISQSC
jgi:hypothetical protein